MCFSAVQTGFTFSQCLLGKKLSWSSGFAQEALPELTAKLLFPAVKLLPTENLTGPLHNEALLPPTFKPILSFRVMCELLLQQWGKVILCD